MAHLIFSEWVYLIDLNNAISYTYKFDKRERERENTGQLFVAIWQRLTDSGWIVQTQPSVGIPYFVLKKQIRLECHPILRNIHGCTIKNKCEKRALVVCKHNDIWQRVAQLVVHHIEAVLYKYAYHMVLALKIPIAWNTCWNAIDILYITYLCFTKNSHRILL